MEAALVDSYPEGVNRRRIAQAKTLLHRRDLVEAVLAGQLSLADATTRLRVRPRIPEAVRALRERIPDYARQQWDGWIKGDRLAGENLIAALPQPMRGWLIRRLYEERLAPALFGPMLAEAWEQSPDSVQASTRGPQQIANMFGYAGIEHPVK
ncbi:hypothetical protein A6A04_12350 [Paramagnetospirillum marisnigri]|uniref:Uncharacterized protein n=2 Tax=Paramagnetospirillum marisnigri TaxID=1285242 RepID=A0A178MUS1_9PROT|nr:hypothetical protein A6A04_12350 [Paramagnetospirillum marisnigri]